MSHSHARSRGYGGTKLNIRYSGEVIDYEWNRSAAKNNLNIALKWAKRQKYVGVKTRTSTPKA